MPTVKGAASKVGVGTKVAVRVGVIDGVSEGIGVNGSTDVGLSVCVVVADAVCEGVQVSVGSAYVAVTDGEGVSSRVGVVEAVNGSRVPVTGGASCSVWQLENKIQVRHRIRIQIAFRRIGCNLMTTNLITVV
jgi:hypothetical protein